MRILYNYLRDYDPTTGRYLESDPIGIYGGSWSTYTYVNDSPVQSYDALGLWKTTGPPPDSENTIICDGSGGISVHLQQLDPLSLECLGDCMTAHEQSHIADALGQNPNICVGVPPGTRVEASGSGRTAAAARAAALKEKAATEIKASNVEIDCLKAKLSKANCDDKCKAVIQQRIQQMIQYRNSFMSGS